MGDGEKCLILQACCLPTLSRAALKKDLVICPAGFEIQCSAGLEIGVVHALIRIFWVESVRPVPTEDMEWEFCSNDSNETKI